MGEGRGVHRVMVGKPKGKSPLGRPRGRWEDYIKMDLQELGGSCGDWMELAQDRDMWRALVGTVRNLRVPNMRGISWLAAEPVSFSRRTLLHGVSTYTEWNCNTSINTKSSWTIYIVYIQWTILFVVFSSSWRMKFVWKTLYICKKTIIIVQKYFMFYPVKLKRKLWIHTVHVADDISNTRCLLFIMSQNSSIFYHKSRKLY